MQALLHLLGISGPAALLVLTAIYAIAAVFSGLSGFGFSAIGSLSLIVLPPQLGVAVLMGLSLLTQAASFTSLRDELRRPAGAAPHRHGWRNGVVPYLAGGSAGMPIGLAILAAFGARQLVLGLGVLLMGYSAWSLFKPVTLRLENRVPRPWRSFLVGAVGGVIGGFSAFPGAALVVWNGLVGMSKEEGRALTQPFILCMQCVGLSLLLATRPQLFGRPFWVLFIAALPAALLGNRIGVAIYRKTGDVGYRRITLAALGVSGAGLLFKVAMG